MKEKQKKDLLEADVMLSHLRIELAETNEKIDRLKRISDEQKTMITRYISEAITSVIRAQNYIYFENLKDEEE